MAAPSALTLYVPDEASVRIIQCSPPSWMAHWVALEKGHRPELVRLDFAAGEHKSAQMLRRNPRGTIPVLEHEGHCVYETLAILSYLDGVLGGPRLMPTEAGARARALSLFHTAGELKNRGMALFAHIMRHAPERGDTELLTLRAGFVEELRFWNEFARAGAGAGAGAGAYLVGDFSLVDCVVFPYLATAHQLGLQFQAPLAALSDYCDRVAQRPALQESRPRTWQSPLDLLS
jgi:glutathione S-transferase